MEVVQKYSEEWPKLFEQEANALRQTISEMLDIQHIGSTAIPGMTSKPIVDIGVLLPTSSGTEKYIGPLELAGYKYFPQSSSSERLFFRKGDPVQFHLSLAYADQGSFWKRQIQFRDYLRTHPEACDEYVQLKNNLLMQYPDGGQNYLEGKTNFVLKVLQFANPEVVR